MNTEELSLKHASFLLWKAKETTFYTFKGRESILQPNYSITVWQEKGTKKKIRSFNSLCRLKHRTNWHGPLLFEMAWVFWSQKCSLCVLSTIRYLGIRGTTQYIMQIWRMHQRIFMNELLNMYKLFSRHKHFNY